MSSEWDEVKKYVEPIVAEIDQPDIGPLIRCEVVIEGDGQESVAFSCFYEGQSGQRNASLLRHAATLLENAARHQEAPRDT